MTKCAVAPMSFTPRACAWLVGVRALEARQERVVDVDAASGEGVAQLGRQDLHVPGEHDELDVVLVDRGEHARLERGLRSRHP